MDLIRYFQFLFYKENFDYNKDVLPFCDPVISFSATLATKNAIAASYKAKYILEGDSIAAPAQLLSKKFYDFAIPGSTIADLAYRFQSTVSRCMPEKIALNIGGNDVMQGKLTFDQSCTFLLSSIKQAQLKIPKNVLKKVAWIKVTPVLKEKAELQNKIIDFNNKMSTILLLNSIEVLDPWPFLTGPDGFLKPEFVGPDGLHWNLAAYELLVPFLNSWFNS